MKLISDGVLAEMVKVVGVSGLLMSSETTAM
jgi:hypothetical protein